MNGQIGVKRVDNFTLLNIKLEVSQKVINVEKQQLQVEEAY